MCLAAFSTDLSLFLVIGSSSMCACKFKSNSTKINFVIDITKL